MLFIGDIFIFGLFDTTSNIQEYESQKFYETILILSISLIIVIGIILSLGFEKKFRFWGGISTIFIISAIQIFQYKEYVTTKQFDKHSWFLSEKNKFIEARSIVLNNSFEGLNKESIINNLGTPNYSESNQLSYEINDLFHWVLSIEFDSCCVLKTELKKEPWNL